jgi:8-oxo-dGTP pyrophosphatase MutT (NUDIX family)
MTPVSTTELAAAIAARPVRRPLWAMEGRIAAAVCVPLAQAAGGLEVWAIKRPDGLRHHAREVAFPGGKPDPADRDLLETALRETEEELGIARALLSPLGALSPVPTATSRFTLHPFVVAVAEEAVPVPAQAEVAALIRMPLDAYYDGRLGYRAVDLGGGRLSPIFDFAEGAMYGASAHILQELLDVYAGMTGQEPRQPELTRKIPWQ